VKRSRVLGNRGRRRENVRRLPEEHQGRCRQEWKRGTPESEGQGKAAPPFTLFQKNAGGKPRRSRRNALKERNGRRVHQGRNCRPVLFCGESWPKKKKVVARGGEKKRAEVSPSKKKTPGKPSATS